MKSINAVIVMLAFSLIMLSCESGTDSSVATEPDPVSITKQGREASVAGVGSTAEVWFGFEDVGSPFPPPAEHDMSIHAKDKMVPRTVVIAQGGSVTYHVSPFHQVAIYGPGKTAGDVKADIASGAATLEDLAVPFPPFVLPDFVINDPVGRVAMSPPLSFGESMWTTPGGTFSQPGRYLVICTTAPHFLVADMFGWVIVK